MGTYHLALEDLHIFWRALVEGYEKMRHTLKCLTNK